jgi:hypothetical protein
MIGLILSRLIVSAGEYRWSMQVREIFGSAKIAHFRARTLVGLDRAKKPADSDWEEHCGTSHS